MNATDICNAALALIGAKNFITDIAVTEDSDEWRLCSQLYAMARDYCCEIAEWDFLIGRTQLAATAAPTIGSYAYAYLLPADCIRVLAMIDAAGDDLEYDQKIEGNTLLTNQTSCYLRYLKENINPAVYPNLFCECIALKLASWLANPIRGENAPKMDWAVLLDEQLTRAQGLYCTQSYEENGNDDVVDAAKEIF
jgi:hypothetical protein